jgi:hypothetical protein
MNNPPHGPFEFPQGPEPVEGQGAKGTVSKPAMKISYLLRVLIHQYPVLVNNAG